MKKSILNSPRIQELKKKRQKALMQRVAIVVGIVVLVGTGLTFIARFERVNIKDVHVSGNKIIDSENIENIVNADIAGHYLWLLPKTNFLLYPKDKIARDLALNFKRLKDITLTIDNNNTLEVKVSEREALYTWCGVRMETEGGSEDCYFLDESGYVLDRAPYFSGDVYFRFYGPITGDVTDPMGSYYARDNFLKLVSFKTTAEKLKTHPVSMMVDTYGEIAVNLSSSKNGQNPKILLKTDADFDKLGENLHTALGTEPLKTKFKNNYSSLQYIDLRFGNKVYFKFAGDSTPVSVKQ